MPANNTPIFTNIPDLGWPGSTNGSVVVSAVNTTTAATSYDGTSGVSLVFTAGTNGSFVQKLVCEAGGPTGNATASVLRVHINNGTAPTNASANTLYMQYSLPTTTAVSITATAHIEIPLMLQLPAGYRIYVSIGSTLNLAGGWFVTTVAGDY
jgi:hypothetical protein